MRYTLMEANSEALYLVYLAWTFNKLTTLIISTILELNIGSAYFIEKSSLVSSK